jgi:hypothetical protein
VAQAKAVRPALRRNARRFNPFVCDMGNTSRRE